MNAPTSVPFADRLADALDRAGSPACLGLDPVVDRLPVAVREGCADAPGAVAAFCRGVLAACRGRIAAVKFQSACFERHGAAGVAVLEDLVRAARAMDLVVVLDAKRGDIGITAEHYARAAFGGEPGESATGADALTVSGYLGPDTVEPFLQPGRGVFVLVRTSNPGSDAVQSARLADGRTVAEMMADHVAALGASRVGRRGLSDVGAVVGATKVADALALRRRMPDQVFLVPGYGAQGGGPDDVRRMVRPGARSPGEAGVLVTASRSIIYAFDPTDRDWRAAVGAAAARFAEELCAIVPA